MVYLANMPTPMTFENYMKEVHAELFPTLLDDNIPDHFDNWLGELDGEEYIQYADDFAVKVQKETIEQAIEVVKESFPQYDFDDDASDPERDDYVVSITKYACVKDLKTLLH